MRGLIQKTVFVMALLARFGLAANLRKEGADPTKLQSQLNSLDQCSSNDIYVAHMAQTTNHIMELLNGDKKERPTLLWIGCSLDRFQINAICNLVGGTTIKYYPEGSSGKKASSIVCHSLHITMGYVQIFGMHKKCHTDAAAFVDPREFDSESDRVRALLPELVESMGSTPTHVQVGSNLWDLSKGCNNQLGITEDYQELYIRGIHEIHDAIADLIPGVHISWRTGMPIHTDYDARGEGRKLVNQEALNQLVEHEVRASSSRLRTHESIGSFLDHWSVVRMAPTDCCMFPDGRHYPKCSSYAFFNNWLNRIYTPDGELVKA